MDIWRLEWLFYVRLLWMSDYWSGRLQITAKYGRIFDLPLTYSCYGYWAAGMAIWPWILGYNWSYYFTYI